MAISPRTCSLGLLARSHAGRIVDETGGTAFGAGWRRVASSLVKGWAAALRPHPGVTITVSAFGEHAGGLRVAFDPHRAAAPPAGLAAQLRRLRDDAEREAAQTCDICGQRGVLRVTAKGDVAIRCDRHGDPGSMRMLRGDAIPTKEILGVLLRSHAAWLDSAGAYTELPRGWVALATEAFAELRKMPTGRGFRLRSLRAVCGRLEVVIEHDIEDLDLQQYLSWRTAVMGLGDGAMFSCDVCGSEGWLRHPKRGVSAPRCDAHADFGRWGSYQWSASTRIDDAMVTISSVRPQWSIGALGESMPNVTAVARAAGDGASRQFALYDVRDVAAAMGLADDDENPGEGPGGCKPPADNEHQARLRRIIDRGDDGRWRRLEAPDQGMVDALDALARRAPHLHELSALVRRHLLAAMTIGLPISLPPLLVLGEPGVGKTWYLTALARVLGVPFQSYPMSGASHSDGIGGAHPVWRNAQLGLVAKTLFGSEVANPLLFVDEFDKVPAHQGVDDLHRPFYALLEPVGSRRFVDAFLQFPIDASGVLWVFAANTLDTIPAPILNRLLVVMARAPDAEQRAVVARSIYADANGRRLAYFPAAPSEVLVDRLAGMGPRQMRIAIEHAMTVAAAGGRREVRADDLPASGPQRAPRMGFV